MNRIEPPEGRIVLDPPPGLQDREGLAGLMTTAVPVLGGIGSIVMVAGMAGRSGQGGLTYLAAGMFLLATLGFAVVQVDRQRQQRSRQVGRTRADYLQHLARARGRVRAAASSQRAALFRRHPSPQTLTMLSSDPSSARRGPADPRLLEVRWGLADQPLSVAVEASDGGQHGPVDPVCASAQRRLIAVHGTQADLPATLDLREVTGIDLRGSASACRAMARALVCSAAAAHGPTDLVVAVLADQDRLGDWEWVKWLPHARSATCLDAVGGRRTVSPDADDLATLLAPSAGSPHLLLVVDGVGPPPDGPLRADRQGITTVQVSDPRAEDPAAPGRVVFRLGDAPARPARPSATLLSPAADPVEGVADLCDAATAEALARRLTASAPPSSAGPGRHAGVAGLLPLLGLDDLRHLDDSPTRLARGARDRLRVPIGVGTGDEVVHLDLKESAEQGMGPHGLVVGATGSGKSELLRTLVLGLTLTHSTDQLSLVLVDFKGGATFSGMSSLPHVSALITNLADDLTLVDRMQDAISGEMVRRQELLRRTGPFASVHDYDRARRTRPELEPVPSLLVVVDEFSELLGAQPDFVDLFVAMGRLGRSLGIHLLLASQRLDEGRLRGLEAHLSYRIALRTFSATESRAVIGVPDAHDLPPDPGTAYLRPGPDRLVRFRAAFVSGARPDPARGPRTAGAHGILPFMAAEVPLPARPARLPERAAPSLVEEAVTRLAGHGPRARRIWLPPLDRPDTVGDLAPDLTLDPDLGLVSRRWRAAGPLLLPVGMVDRPREQRRDVLTVDLRGAHGHVAVVGAPRSGKSTLLRSMVAALSLTTTPRESAVFALDLGGGALRALDGLPHVAGVAGRTEPDVVRRLVAEVRGIVDRREAYFREHGLDSIETYRRARKGDGAEGPDDGYGEVFLVVDGWSSLRADFEDLEPDLQALAARGLSFGLHLLVATTRWSDLRASARDLFGSRLELRLGDPVDSEVDRRLAALVPTRSPGRGLTPEGLHLLTALPRIDGRNGTDDLADGVEDLVRRVADAWHGPAGPRLRLLPDRVRLAEVRRAAGDGRGGLLIGLDEQDLGPVALDPERDRHLLVLGDGGSGKTALLRTLVHEVVRTRTPAQAQLVVVDPRRSLLGEVPEAHLLHHLGGALQAAPALAELAAYLERRLPGPDVTPAQLRERSWWTGAEVFVLVDDHDLVSGATSPLAPLVPLLSQARDVGLHLVVARRTGGAARALYEPLLQTLRELAAPGLLLAGDPEEGPLVGGLRPTAAVPGRGRLVTRDRGARTVQLAWQESETRL